VFQFASLFAKALAPTLSQKKRESNCISIHSQRLAAFRLTGVFAARFFINSSFSLMRVLTSFFTNAADNGLVGVKRTVPFEV
jgi:hypothetical protein